MSVFTYIITNVGNTKEYEITCTSQEMNMLAQDMGIVVVVGVLPT